MIKAKSVSKVKNKSEIKIIPADRSKNTVVFDDIVILLNDGVGNLLTNNKAITTVR